MSYKDDQVLDWYLRLHSRTLDLVGDYAGNERFLIEGDSLLLHCFEDLNIDFEDGFQLLHAVYAVEHFLESLTRRLCNFHIVFFRDHKQLCIPPYKSRQKPLYLLARSVVIRHLTCHLPKSNPEIEIHSFSSTHDTAFKEYLESLGIYFIMSHDGAIRPVNVRSQNISTNEQVGLWQKIALRSIIRDFVLADLNVALINELEIRDTKVMTMIVERKHDTPISSRTLTVSANDLEAPSNDSNDLARSLHSLSLKHTHPEQEPSPSALPNTDIAFTERLHLVLCSLARLLVERPSRAPLACAFLLHAVIMSHISLSDRRAKDIELSGETEVREYRNFLKDFAVVAEAAITSPLWEERFENCGTQCDVADVVDGRLFKTVLVEVQGKTDAAMLLPEAVIQDFSRAAGIVQFSTGVHLKVLEKNNFTGRVLLRTPEGNAISSLLPFRNAVFDQHLISIKIDIQDSVDTNKKSARIFSEITHWHSSKKPIDRIKAVKASNDLVRKRYLRFNQRFMDEMMKYAASLTNAAGKMLEPQVVTVQKGVKITASVSKVKKEDVPWNTKQSARAKTKQASGAKDSIQASINSKKDADRKRVFSTWKTMRDVLDKVLDPEMRYKSTRTYIQGLSAEKFETIGAEANLYNLQPLLEIWSGFCRTDERGAGYKIAALLWNNIKELWKLEDILTKTIVSHTLEVCIILGFPIDDRVTAKAIDGPLSFNFRIPSTQSYSLSIDLPQLDFQLLHCGPYLDRNIDSRADERVPFIPDGWQRAVLDELDAEHSVFVVAPTSAGKTFISFYAMEKVLRADDDSVLVYVAPTKALVNQIGAEIQARFSKSYKHGGKSVWAIHTRDYRVNNATGCQVLVTVPHILQIMLLAPSNAKSWAPRVKRIIFDEVHSIGNADDGVVWEQLLLLAPCPIIALSATVGNPEKFNDWLAATQSSSGYKLTMIQHQHRYSDLRKFVYSPPKRFSFGGFKRQSTLGNVGLDDSPQFRFLHPVASLASKSRGIPADLALEARDCLTLWQVMVKYQTPNYLIPENLSPKASCSQKVVAKIDVTNWDKKLKELLSMWMSDADSPFDNVLQELGSSHFAKQHTALVDGGEGDEVREAFDPNNLHQTAVALATDLRCQNALPAIFFNYDRTECEKIAKIMLESLEQAETAWKETSPKWKSLTEGYEKYQTNKKVKLAKPGKGKNKDKDSERLSRIESEREVAERDANPFELFDPNAPREEYSFADMHKAEKPELEDFVKKLERVGVVKWLVVALSRGIGVHHAGMNRKYRQTVEILFRKGYLTVVIATGTLALGINMPCKTVVFSGDSVFLTALNFRQCAGRAGRRGFDILGNVVFHGISLDKTCRLLSSRLPDLNGHFPMTTTLVLRLFTLLHESKNSAYAQRAISSLLSQPRLYLGGESFKDQVLHHVRFSIEYLRKQQLLGPGGEPINFTGCISHLYFTANSSFAFHALLKAGYFHNLCADVRKKPKIVLRQLMLVMANLFGRRPCRQSDSEFMEKVVKKSPSIVFLPGLPKQARRILQEHDQETLETFTTYVKTFAKQHMTGDDRTLPLTKISFGSSNPIGIDALRPLPSTTARSHFIALSGHSDTFTSISDLCSSTRSGIFLEKAVIPHLDVFSFSPLNAYLYDFFMHGAVEPLKLANGIRRGDIWFVLNDFSMVLATIVTSLLNFMKVQPMDDAEMTNISGQGDVMEEGADDEEERDGPRLNASEKVKEEAAAGAFGEEEEDETDADGYTSSSSGSFQQEGLLDVLVAMQMLQAEFDRKFKAMWA